MTDFESLLPAGVTPEVLLAELQAELTLRRRRNRVLDYRPYPKQLLFHELGLSKRERLLRAGNQLGKTFCGAAEASFHLTGRYPDWWPGRRFDKPTRAWAGGKDSESVRDSVVKLLLGPPGDRGTGAIPHDAILDWAPARGISDGVDTCDIRHVSGDVSRLKFKSYDQGRQRWQADTLDWIWFDEEPPEPIYTEGLSRTNATGGFVWMTFTPLLGMSDVVGRFYNVTHPDRVDVCMTIEEAEHISAEDRAKIIESYPAHEREARTRGVPMLGGGRVFPFAREQLAVAPFAIPRHWGKIAGMDFGWDHPTAAVKLAHDCDSDTIYVTDIYRVRQQTPLIHAGALKAWGPGLPFAWPHDGLQHDKGSGLQLAEIYRSHGLSLLHERATFEDDRGSGVEAGVMDILDRMTTGRWRVFSHLTEWFEEMELYHRLNGVLVKKRDDLMDAGRYALMMLRFAQHAPPPGVTARRQVVAFDPTADWGPE